MNKSYAKKLAKNITNQQLKQMLDNARAHVLNWEGSSIVNKHISKGMAWNILAKDFDENKEYHILAKINMIREFGKFLPKELLPEKKEKKKFIPIHEDPIFNEMEKNKL